MPKLILLVSAKLLWRQHRRSRGVNHPHLSHPTASTNRVCATPAVCGVSVCALCASIISVRCIDTYFISVNLIVVQQLKPWRFIFSWRSSETQRGPSGCSEFDTGPPMPDSVLIHE